MSYHHHSLPLRDMSRSSLHPGFDGETALRLFNTSRDHNYSSSL